MDKIIVKWLGHSCFKLSFGDYTVVLDPYRDGSVEGLENVREEANRVYCSHGHSDHNARDLIKITPAEGGPKVTRVPTFHDDKNGRERGKNLITVFEWEGFRLAHFGDLGHTLSREQKERISRLDLAMIPVGGFFTIDAPTAKKVADDLGVKTVIPMHYRRENFGFGVLGTVEKFTDLYDKLTYRNRSEIVLDSNTPEGVLVLTPALAKK